MPGKASFPGGTRSPDRDAGALRIRRPKDEGSHCVVHPKGCVYKTQPCLPKWDGNGGFALRAAALRAGLAKLAFAPCRGVFKPPM